MTWTLVTWLVDKLVAWFDLDPVHLFRDQIHQRVDVEAAVEAQDLDPVNVWPEALDPITKLQRVDDDPGAVYVWILGDDATQKDVDDWAARINRVFLEAYGHSPNAAHVPVRGLKDVKRLTSTEMERALKPWLREPPNTEGTS